MVKVKICGITNAEDAARACEYGADLLGFIFVEGTPRAVEKDTVKDIVSSIPAGVGENTEKVGLFRDESLGVVAETLMYCGLESVQLHGDESPDYCRELKEKLPVNIIKVFKVREDVLPAGSHVIDDYGDVDHFVFDTFHPETPGGTGSSFDWEVLLREKGRIKKPFFIAGGLDPANVAEAVRTVRPYGVDVSSGVEKVPGKKDENLLKEFIKNAKKA
jgi:phosphoribosylanthranilate isomerase